MNHSLQHCMGVLLMVSAGYWLASPPSFGQDLGEEVPRRPLTVEQLEPLTFGELTADAGRSGSVTIDPRTGAKSITGGLENLGGNYAPARFLVQGEPGAQVVITLPGHIELIASNASGPRATLDDFRSHPKDRTVLDPDGEATIDVGATLRLERVRKGAAFSGRFEIHVDYQD